jgi:hypothetical protein
VKVKGEETGIKLLEMAKEQGRGVFGVFLGGVMCFNRKAP